MINPFALRAAARMIREAREFEDTLRDITGPRPRTVTARFSFRYDGSKLRKIASQVDHTRRRLICHRDPMLRRFRRCEANCAPEVLRDEP